jgi:hypothetical protein
VKGARGRGSDSHRSDSNQIFTGLDLEDFEEEVRDRDMCICVFIYSCVHKYLCMYTYICTHIYVYSYMIAYRS